VTIAADSRAATSAVALSPPRPRRLGRDVIALIRPHQWVKNLLVVPLALLDVPFTVPEVPVRLAWAVLLFTLASSVVYVCNDIYDRHRDRNHPTKRHRPIAAGRISVPVAYLIAALLLTLLTGAVVLGPASPVVAWPIAVYLALNLVYSRRLKHLPLVDVFVVALGFVLRVVQGYLVVAAPIGPWLLIAVLAVCLLFLLGKRRHEVTVGGTAHRPSLRGYSTQYLDHLAVLCAVLAVVAFFLHLQQRLDGPYLTLALLGSAPFALFALARYLQVLFVDGDGGDPTRLLMRDPALRVNSLLWGVLLASTLAAAQLPLVLS